MNGTGAIARILSDLTGSYLTLRDLLEAERQSLHDLDASAVEELSKRKDTALMRIRLLEEERARLTSKFAHEHPEACMQSPVSLRRIAEHTGDAALEAQRSMLMSIVQACSELNSVNKVLIERSLRYVRNSTRFFESLGIATVSADRPGRLLSKET